MTKAEAIAQLDALVERMNERGYIDVEGTHVEADAVILNLAGPKVIAAYQRVIDAAGAWWFA